MNPRWLLTLTCATLLVFFFSFAANANDWTQLGADINGQAVGDDFGYSSAMSGDGNTIVIGARFNDTNGTDSGQVRVYGFDGMSWNQIGAELNGDAAGDRFGACVAMSNDGNTIGIAASNSDSNGTDSGQTRVYSFDGANWNQLGADIDGEAAGDVSGVSVDLSSDGNTIVIGEPGSDSNGSGSGQARVFRFDGISWNQLGANIVGEAAGDRAARAVAISADGNTIVIGAIANDGGGSDSGHSRIYRFDGAAWNQLGADIDGEAANDSSGNTVALSSDGNTVVVGDVLSDDNGTNAGKARVFRFDGVNWIQLGADLIELGTGGPGERRIFGSQAAMSSDGNTILISSAGEGAGGGSVLKGRVHIYRFDGVAWNQLGSRIDGQAVNDNAGLGDGGSVDMSSDGNTIVIGAPSSFWLPDAGRARIYRISDPNGPPTADAGANQSIRAGDTVNLDGSASFDDNTATALLDYAWSFVSKPGTSTASLDDATSATPTFVADVAGTYTLALVVTDEAGLPSDPAFVEISSDNLAPTAVASVNLNLAIVGDTAFFDGSSSIDPEMDPLTYSWSITAAPTGSTATLVGADTDTPTLITDVEGTYNVTLTVSDFLGPGTPATVSLVATTAEDFAEIQIVFANDYVETLLSTEVTTAGNHNAFGNFLTQAMSLIQEGDTIGAIDKLNKAISRTDGCFLRGSPDGNGPGRDWITDCDAQLAIYDLLTQAVDALQP